MSSWRPVFSMSWVLYLSAVFLRLLLFRWTIAGDDSGGTPLNVGFHLCTLSACDQHRDITALSQN